MSSRNEPNRWESCHLAIMGMVQVFRKGNRNTHLSHFPNSFCLGEGRLPRGDHRGLSAPFGFSRGGTCMHWREGRVFGEGLDAIRKFPAGPGDLGGTQALPTSLTGHQTLSPCARPGPVTRCLPTQPACLSPLLPHPSCTSSCGISPAWFGGLNLNILFLDERLCVRL